MRPANGYLTNDGQFFETAEEAQRHEAETTIILSLSINYPTVDPAFFLDVVRRMPIAIRSYINADEQAKERECHWINEPPISEPPLGTAEPA